MRPAIQRPSAAPVRRHAPELRSGFFPPAVVQPRLAVNEPGDVYEREADAVAEAVMRSPAAAGALSASEFGTAPPPITPLQRKCAACAEEERLQREEGQEEEVFRTPEPRHDLPGGGDGLPLQRLAIDCSMFSQKEEEIDAADEAALEAAVPGGAEAVQRKCRECEDEERTVQRRDEGSTGAVSSSFESDLDASRGRGSPLPEPARAFMEDRFAADFSGVRVHTDASAAALSTSINAHAFTRGQDIYFNRGQYDPGASGGRQLLAHELTHVVQQTGAEVRGKARPGPRPAGIQRAFYFSPHPKGWNLGTEIHRAVLPLFVAANADLFIEVAIPGANKTDVDKGKTGIADFYKASTTIGIKFDEAPKNLPRDSDFQAGSAAGANFDHARNSAPKGANATPRVRRLGTAPASIEIGDLKPGGSSESVLGTGQVANYKTGITNTRSALNSYLSTRPAESDHPTLKSWSLAPNSPSSMSSLTIPSDLLYTVGGGIRGLQNRKLGLYREGDTHVHTPTGMTGTMYVYKDRSDGVWAYEWIPDPVPASTGSQEVNTVLDRLNTDVISALTQTQGTSIAPKRAPLGRYRLMRKAQGFDDAAWKKEKYSPWKTRATRVLADKGEMKKADIAVGIVDIERRSGLTVDAPEKVKEQGRGLPKVRHWKRFGGFYGWLREKFDRLYVKVKNLVDKVKKKVKDLAKRAGSTSFGSWIKAVAKVVFKIFKMVGSWIVTQVMDKLIGSLRQGVMSNVSKLIEKALPDDAKVYLERFCALQKQYDDILAMKEEDLIALLFGDRLKLFETADAIEEKIGYVADIATLIEWGVRLLACASPPAIGCLWNLAIEALKWAFAKLLQTCWFTKEVYAPVIDKVDLVKQFPSELASTLVKEFNGHLPVPAGLDPWFAPITVNLSEFKVECNEAADGGARLTPERKAIFEIAMQEGGAEKLKAALQLMRKRGAGDWVLLDRERIEKLKKALESASAQEMTDAAHDSTKPVPPAMEDLVGDIQAYTPAEKKLIKQAREAKERTAVEEALVKILSEPYPSRSQLKADLDSVAWDLTAQGSYAIRTIDGRRLLYGRTVEGARVGAHFKVFATKFAGKDHLKIVDTSLFYNLDPVPSGDRVGTAFVDLNDRTRTIFGSIIFGPDDRPLPVGSRLDLGDGFIGLLLEEAAP